MNRNSGFAAAVRTEGGASLAELMIALVVLSIGIMAVAQLFPASSRGQLSDRMRSTATLYAQDKLEELRALPFTDAALTAGRHPAGTATEALGTSGRWQRFYTVTNMAAPLDNLKQVVVQVNWTSTRSAFVTTQTYIRQ